MYVHIENFSSIDLIIYEIEMQIWFNPAYHSMATKSSQCCIHILLRDRVSASRSSIIRSNWPQSYRQRRRLAYISAIAPENHLARIACKSRLSLSTILLHDSIPGMLWAWWCKSIGVSKWNENLFGFYFNCDRVIRMILSGWFRWIDWWKIWICSI